MKKRRLLSVFIIMAMISSLFASVASAATTNTTIKTKTQSINLLFDGQALKLPDEQYSFIYMGRTYVPIRYISYALQKSVKWDPAKSTASISNPTEEELADLKKQLQNAITNNKKSQANVEIAVKQMKATLVFDGKAKTVPAGQFLFNYKGSIYVPLRFLSESVGVTIDWDPVTKTISSESKAYRDEQAGGGSGKPDEGGNGSGGGPTTGGPGGGPGTVEPKLTYEEITSDAQTKLTTLRNSCMKTIDDLFVQYLNADPAGRAAIKAQGLQEVDSCSSKFEIIMTDTTAMLTKNGFSTAIIAEYRATFNKELDAGRELAEQLG